MEGSVQKVTIYVGSRDTWQGRNLATALVERCRALGLAGATMTRGNMGFGKNSLIHRAHLLGLSDDMPERIEVIDRSERIREVLPILDEMVGAGLIVVQDVQAIQYRHETKAAGEAGRDSLGGQ
jgi:PII-like signaling protein